MPGFNNPPATPRSQTDLAMFAKAKGLRVRDRLGEVTLTRFNVSVQAYRHGGHWWIGPVGQGNGPAEQVCALGEEARLVREAAERIDQVRSWARTELVRRRDSA